LSTHSLWYLNLVYPCKNCCWSCDHHQYLSSSPQIVSGILDFVFILLILWSVGRYQYPPKSWSLENSTEDCLPQFLLQTPLLPHSFVVFHTEEDGVLHFCNSHNLSWLNILLLIRMFNQDQLWEAQWLNILLLIRSKIYNLLSSLYR